MLRILLVNPPVYDFAAYDFWLRPYGLLSIAGYLRGKASFRLFDYMDRRSRLARSTKAVVSDAWGRGRFIEQRIEPPAVFSGIPRRFRRFGLPREVFRGFLAEVGPFDVVLVQTMMTYWYPALREVIDDVRQLSDRARVVLGGNYATLCGRHAERLGADLVVKGMELATLWDFLGLSPDLEQPGLWEAYEDLGVGVLKLTQGCPFACTYCSVPMVYGRFEPRSLDRSLTEMELLAGRGARNVAFYDDALLFRAQEVLVPFLEEVLRRGIRAQFHSPNALNARFVTGELAQLMVRAGVKTFYLGFECARRQVQEATGGKVYSEELAEAVRHLTDAGADRALITAYQILGHPDMSAEDVEASMQFVRELGIRGMLADFSPIPGTPDGRRCEQWVDMNEPLTHNKTAFTIWRMGFETSNRLKDLQRRFNREIGS